MHSCSTAEFPNHLAVRPTIASTPEWPAVHLQCYTEPKRVEELRIPGTPDPYISVLVAGQSQVYCRDDEHSPVRSARIHAGCVALSSRHHPYIIGWDTLSPEPARVIHLHLDSARFHTLAAELSHGKLDGFDIADQLSGSDPLIFGICRNLAEELATRASDPHTKMVVETSAQLLAVHLLRHYAPRRYLVRSARGGLSSHTLKRVTGFARDHLGEELSLAQLAAVAGMSSFHFLRAFRESTGQTPHRWVMELRIQRARELLRTTTLPVREISRLVGYRSDSHFAAAFRRRVGGLTPQAYRRDYGNARPIRPT